MYGNLIACSVLRDENLIAHQILENQWNGKIRAVWEVAEPTQQKIDSAFHPPCPTWLDLNPDFSSLKLSPRAGEPGLVQWAGNWAPKANGKDTRKCLCSALSQLSELTHDGPHLGREFAQL